VNEFIKSELPINEKYTNPNISLYETVLNMW
jgi:hypothetical protein